MSAEAKICLVSHGGADCSRRNNCWGKCVWGIVVIMESIAQVVDPVFLFNILYALFLGAMVGAERELRHKPAGMGTHTFIIGAAMMFSFFSVDLGMGDPARIASQIVPGIGFLGAGIIFYAGKDRVRNVTTAASVWFSAAIGMGLGFGYYGEVFLAACFAVIVARIPRLRNFLGGNVGSED